MIAFPTAVIIERRRDPEKPFYFGRVIFSDYHMTLNL